MSNCISTTGNTETLQHKCALVMSGVVIISSALHFWPFMDSKLWQAVCPPNFIMSLWIPVLLFYTLVKRSWRDFASQLPHISVLAYLGINILSVAFAPDFGRAASFTVKLGILFVGGYLLFGQVISNTKSIRMLFAFATIALILSVSCSLIKGLLLGYEGFGFFDNKFKYGTYVGILAPLCGTYFLAGPTGYRNILGIVLVIISIVSCGNLGGQAAIIVGMLAAAVVIQKKLSKVYIVLSLLGGIGILLLVGTHQRNMLRHDIILAEENGTDLRQRYIEWQAQVNLVENRTVTGTGAGCINHYRSSFYYRLPKLNTLEPFDQNGWLATGSEIGILGLVCFCWLVVYHAKTVWSLLNRQLHIQYLEVSTFAIAGFAGLIASCVANIFSSVNYNGILVAFVLVLVLISGTDRIYKGG